MPECKYFITKNKLILTVKKSWNFRLYMEILSKTHRIPSTGYSNHFAYICLYEQD